jgi:hypothetical protein
VKKIVNQPANQNNHPPRPQPKQIPPELAWLGWVLILAAFAALMVLGGNPTPPPPASLDRMPATVAGQPSATATMPAAAVRLATPPPPPTAVVGQPGAATTTTGGPRATVTSVATGRIAPTKAAPPTNAPASGAVTPIAPSANPNKLVMGVAIPMAQSDPGSWQVSQDGSTTYQLPEGAAEGEALGQLATSGVNLSVQLASTGEDCGVAVGSPQNFTLLRLRPTGQSELDVLLDQWQGDNYTTPPPATTLIIKNDAASKWHTLTLTMNSGQLTYTVDGRAGTAAASPPPGSSAYLYAGGGGCEYRPAP